MDANSGTNALLPRQQSWNAIFAEVNAWRGGCLHHFSKVETAVTETLLALSDIAPAGASVRLRHLIGQRLEDLAAAIAPEGPFSEAGKSGHTELSNYREKHESFRSLLCHSVAKVTIDQNGEWIVLMRTLVLRARQPERNVVALEKIEAEEKLAALKTDGRKLMTALENLRRIAAG